ncbi:MAG TPA: HlyD family efflux transporter periplasmic adaptor subunit [Fimbriimonadales bacterium]|jgi:multidrug resistance efflux pump|nr:HlyD family efflux transporter periplasmic adaptor subunit [Fimbriimonadales bacterium]
MRKFAVAAVIIAALLVGGYFYDHSRSAKESVLSGYFESEPTQTSSRIGGRIVALYVREGENVKRGQRLARLQSTAGPEYEAKLEVKNQAEQTYLAVLHGPRKEDIARQKGAVAEARAGYEKALAGPLPEEISAAKSRAAQARAKYREALAGARPQEIAAARHAASVALANYRAAQRGPTEEEIGRLRAAVSSATAARDLAKKTAERSRALYEGDAISRQQLEADEAAFAGARAALVDAQEAYQRGIKGTPPEELAAARERYLEADAQRKLVEAGTRPEEIEAFRQAALAAEQESKLLARGTRPEDVAAAKARLDQQNAALAMLLRGSRPEDIAKARAALREAEAVLAASSINSKEDLVVAPFDGHVDSLPVAKGDVVSPGEPIVQLSDPDNIWIRLYVPEDELSKVHPGDTADLRVDGIEGTVQAVVESVAARGEFTPANLQSPEERAHQVFAVRLRLAHPDARVKAGMYATAKRVGSWP